LREGRRGHPKPHVAGDGSITPVFTFFDRATLREEKKPLGKLAFGVWK
jgi:hypothetical protein